MVAGPSFKRGHHSMKTLPELEALTYDELRVMLAEIVGNAMFAAKAITPHQNPPGTEGYKCDLSGLWILKDHEDRNYGMNYKTPEAAISAFYQEHAREHNYPCDLNACHKIENQLTDDQHDDFRGHLADLTSSAKTNQSERMRESERLWISAKPHKRTIALILTLQKP